jgi:hypothetical protein
MTLVRKVEVRSKILFQSWVSTLFFISSYERNFILTGLTLDDSPPTDPPQDSTERPDRQAQLLAAVNAYIEKLNPNLSSHKILYVRVLKSPAPYVLEVECENKAGFVLISLIICRPKCLCRCFWAVCCGAWFLGLTCLKLCFCVSCHSFYESFGIEPL